MKKGDQIEANVYKTSIKGPSLTQTKVTLYDIDVNQACKLDSFSEDMLKAIASSCY